MSSLLADGVEPWSCRLCDIGTFFHRAGLIIVLQSESYKIKIGKNAEPDDPDDAQQVANMAVGCSGRNLQRQLMGYLLWKIQQQCANYDTSWPQMLDRSRAEVYSHTAARRAGLSHWQDAAHSDITRSLPNGQLQKSCIPLHTQR